MSQNPPQSQDAPAESLLTRVAVNRSGATLLVIGLVDSIGTGLYLAGSAIFFTRVIGLSTAQVGLGLSLAGLVGFLLQAPIGWLADRTGPRRMLIILNVWRAVGFVAYVFVHDFALFLLVAIFLGAPEQATYPVNQALSHQVVGAEKRVALMARVRVVYNVGFTLGALIATAALHAGTRTAFGAIMIGNAVTFLFAALMLPRVRLLTTQVRTRVRDSLRGARLTAVRDGRYVLVGAMNAVLSLHISLLAIGIPLWVTLHTDAPRAVVGPLLVVNTVLAVALQVRASHGTDTVAGSVRAMRRAGVALALCCALFAAAGHVSATVAVVLLVAAIVAETAGELYQSAGGWGLSYALAPERAHTEYLATFNLGASAQFVLGPTIVTVGVVNAGTAGWLALGAAFLVFGLLVRPAAAAAARHLAATEPTAPPAPATTAAGAE